MHPAPFADTLSSGLRRACLQPYASTCAPRVPVRAVAAPRRRFFGFIPIHIHWRRDRVAAPPCHQRMPTVWVEQPFIDRNGEQHIPMAVIAQTPVAATLSCPRAPNIINVYLALPGRHVSEQAPYWLTSTVSTPNSARRCASPNSIDRVAAVRRAICA